MNKFAKTNKDLTLLNFYILIAVIVWLLATSASLFWNIYNKQQSTHALAIKEARSHFNKDKTFRLWVASHGGVYVPLDERTPPNPYLSHLPERDITKESGEELTLMNAAYVYRQMISDNSELFKIKGHISSLKPLNPINKPSEWERKALLAFERGEKEVTDFVDIDGKSFLTLMSPMITQEACLKCHAFQGYKVDDILGGVGVSVPMDGYLSIQRKLITIMIWTHLGIFLMGLTGILFVSGRFKKHLLERKESEQMLIQQSKLASMGEMLSNIAHQWRQPLSGLNLIIQDIKDAYLYKELTDDYLNKSVEQANELTRYMSRTIDDFRDFFKPSKEKETFDIKMITGKALSMYTALFNIHNISYKLTCNRHNKSFTDISEVVSCEDMIISSYRTEVLQVMVNLISNARDVIRQKQDDGLLDKGYIHIGFFSTDNHIIVKVQDNGGGIPYDIINKIFEPYFTTKFKSQGTGIGLYMSKLIIEKNIGGEIRAENNDIGALFIVKIPKLLQTIGTERYLG